MEVRFAEGNILIQSFKDNAKNKNNVIKYKQLDNCLDQSDSCRRSALYNPVRQNKNKLIYLPEIFQGKLLTSNPMIFLVQFGINKSL